METPHQLQPADTVMAEWHQAWKILNQFRLLGFTRREAFVEVVQSKDPEYYDYKKIQKLIGFWLLRVRDENLNRDLQKVLEQLKTE